MLSRFRPALFAATAFTLPLALTACGQGADNTAELAELDDNLTTPDGDPAMKAALEDQILVDPNLVNSANGNAVRGANQPLDGSVPPGTGPDAAVNGKGLLSAPKPRVLSEDEECTTCGGNGGMTLGAKAESQHAQRGKGTCDQRLDYSMAWANRMPAEFPVYPRASVEEAAGVEGGQCDIRVASFVTPVKLKDVVDYYYTRAKRSGYTADYVLRKGEHTLGGTRDNDDGAYVITFAQRAQGGTAVDIVANNGR
jgi:hypothetical protein